MFNETYFYSSENADAKMKLQIFDLRVTLVVVGVISIFYVRSAILIFRITTRYRLRTTKDISSPSCKHRVACGQKKSRDTFKK